MADEFKVQWSVSLPPAAQYAKGDMLNLRGESVEEVQALFDAILDGNSEFITKATQVANFLRAEGAVTDAGAAAGSVETPKASSSSDDKPVAGYVCEHGKREFRTGDKKNGKGKWKGYFCPEKNRSAQCEVVWVD